jgi:hypothetical protein
MVTDRAQNVLEATTRATQLTTRRQRGIYTTPPCQHGADKPVTTLNTRTLHTTPEWCYAKLR